MSEMILDLDKLNKYVNENSKKSVRNAVFLIGAVCGTITPTLDLNLDSIKNGLLIGLVIGFIWIALRYKKLGESGIMKTQNEMAVVIVYMFYFFLGAIGGYYLVRPLLYM